MIERRALVADAIVGQRQQERDERVLLRIGKAERTNLRIRERVRKVAAAVVVVDDLTERRLPAVVEVRPEQLDVAQRRRLETSLAGFDDVAGVFDRRPDADVHERVAARIRRVGERRTAVTVVATSLSL